MAKNHLLIRHIAPLMSCCFALFNFAPPPIVAQAPAQPLHGIVIAANGKPAAGAVVWAAKFDYDNQILQRRETIADVQGKFVLNLDTGEWSVRARMDSQGGEADFPSDRVKIDAGKAPTPVTITLEERGRFHGRLLEAETGKPIAGGQLYLDAGLVLTADANGKFEMGGLERTNHEAFVYAPGRRRMRVLFDTTGRSDAELEISVPPGGKLVGRVTDLDGKPIAHAYVGNAGSGRHFSLAALYTACAPDGTFEYHGVMPERLTHRISAYAPGYVSEDFDGPAVGADGRPIPLTFRLRKTPSDDAKAPGPQGEKQRVVSGIVRDPKKNPVAGVLVRWGWPDIVGAIQAPTDSEGRFHLIVPDSDGLLAVLPREFAPAYRQVAKGGDRKVDVTLDPGHNARGQVIDDLGKPIKGVWVVAVTAAPGPGFSPENALIESSARTNAEGRFEVKGIPEGASFSFLKAGLTDLRNFALDLSREDHVVTMTYGGAIKGRMLDRDGKPIRNCRVLLAFPRERKLDDVTQGFFAGYSGIGVRFTSPDGSFVFTGVGAGSVYRVTVVAPGHGEAVVDRVHAAPRNRLDKVEATVFRATLPTKLRVRAVTADDKPVAGAHVTLINGQEALDRGITWGYDNVGWDDTVRARTGADGWAEFPALSFSGATVAIEAPGYGRQRFGWRDKRDVLTATLAKEAVLDCRVFDEVGAVLKSFYIRMRSKEGDSISAYAGPGADGKIRFAELPASEWTLSIHDGAGRNKLYEGKVNLTAGATKELSIVTKAP